MNDVRIQARSISTLVKHDGKREYISEFRAAVRKQEKAMFEEWKRFVEEEE